MRARDTVEIVLNQEEDDGPGFKTTCGRAWDFSVKGTRVQNHLLPFRNLGNFVHPALPVSFGKDIKATGPFYLVSMPAEIKDPMQGDENNL